LPSALILGLALLFVAVLAAGGSKPATKPRARGRIPREAELIELVIVKPEAFTENADYAATLRDAARRLSSGSFEGMPQQAEDRALIQAAYDNLSDTAIDVIRRL
jgi:hypothetical protein